MSIAEPRSARLESTDNCGQLLGRIIVKGEARLSQYIATPARTTPTPHIPDALLAVARELYWSFIYRVLTIATPIGRKAGPKIHSRGGPLIRISMKQVLAAGVTLLPRLTGVEGRAPMAEGASVPRPSTVIWATGFRPGPEWIEGVPLDAGGLPDAPRGVVASRPGLYFVGMPFQFGLTSQLLGGVGRDAEFVAERIAERQQANTHTGGSASALPKK